MKKGLLPDGFPIVTEMKKTTQSIYKVNEAPIEKEIKNDSLEIEGFFSRVIENLNEKITKDPVIELAKLVFP